MAPTPVVDVSTPASLARALAASGAIPRLVSYDASSSPSSSSLRERPIQSLWAGYGTISELELEVEAEENDGGSERGKKKKNATATAVIVCLRSEGEREGGREGG